MLSKTTELSCLGSRKADCSRKPGVRPYQRSRVSGNLVSPSSKLGKHKIEAVGAGETDVARSHVTPEIKRSFWEFPWRRRPGSTMTHMEGTINLEMMFLKNGYRLGDKLGKGSFAVVKKAVHLPTARDLAVKIVDHNLATKEFLEKFLSREMNIIGGLKHPNIIDVEKVLLESRIRISAQAQKTAIMYCDTIIGTLTGTDIGYSTTNLLPHFLIHSSCYCEVSILNA